MRLARAFLALFLLALSFGAAAQSVDFGQLERQLRLKPHQKEQFREASSATQTALVASAMALVQLKQDLADELAKPRPDFAAVLRAQQAALELNEPLYRKAADEWSKLYELLEPDQVVIVKRFLEQQLRGLPGLFQ